ncbi:hypothetical protein IQ07DRAFT_522266 [Pyrenochaeta sp. DS3sAY3a]|nr:hypothetical protein IQ07DRAFT_522266 [Pyrenochaeta sp. DS3sAY3a]
MVAVNHPLSDHQRAWHLESLLVNGNGEQALEEWEEHYSSASKDPHNRFAPEYLAFGVRLHALFGHVDQAQRLSDTLFKEHPGWDDSLLLSVFRAHTSSDLKAHHDQAKTIYHTLKAKENKSLSLEEYDGYLVGFLEAGSLRSARQVFRDMVYDGTLVTRGSAEDVDEVLKRLHMIYRLSTNMESMTSIALFAMSFLPHAYHNHIFGDWMKSAVDHRAPEAAAQVLNLMFQRGHKPGVYHFNMLLHALLRSKSEENTQKAENIGWRMVEQARNTQIPSIGSRTRAENIKKRNDSSFSMGPDIATEIPAGNITTFALMMQHHTRLHQWEHVEYLARDLEDSAIPPNFAVMNVLMDNKCRQGAYSEVWSIYKTLSQLREEDNGVFPNGASIRCLWKTLRFSLGDYATRGDPKMPTPRELLKETVDWWSMARSRFDAQRFRQGLVGIDHDASTRLILHCFSYTSDLAGSLVALHVLRHELGVYPTEKEAEILQRQMAWVDMASDSESVRSQFFHGRSNTRNRNKVAKLYQGILKMRLNWMGISSKEFASLPAKERGDALLNVLSALVRCILLRGSSPWIVEAKIDAARRAVGLPRLPTGDVDAYDVTGEDPEKD